MRLYYLKFLYSKFSELIFKRSIWEKIKIWGFLILFLMGTMILTLVVYRIPYSFNLSKNLASSLSLLFTLLIIPLNNIGLILFIHEYIIKGVNFIEFIKAYVKGLRRWFLRLFLVHILFYIILMIVGFIGFIFNSVYTELILGMIYFLLGVFFWSIPFFIIIEGWDKKVIEWFKFSLLIGKRTFFDSLKISLFNAFILIGVPLLIILIGFLIPGIIMIIPLFVVLYIIFTYPFITAATLWTYIHLLKRSLKDYKS